MDEKHPDEVPATSDGKHRPSDEPKRSGEVGSLRTRSVAVRPQNRLLHDPQVQLEEYIFYAERSRAEEDHDAKLNPAKLTLKSVFVPSAGKTVRDGNGEGVGAGASGAWDAVTELNLSDPAVRAGISDEEWTNASRALRTASAAACFYLITTDILGPFGVGFALGTMGWGEGFGLYTLFGIMAGV